MGESAMIAPLLSSTSWTIASMATFWNQISWLSSTLLKASSATPPHMRRLVDDLAPPLSRIPTSTISLNRVLSTTQFVRGVDQRAEKCKACALTDDGRAAGRATSTRWYTTGVEESDLDGYRRRGCAHYLAHHGCERPQLLAEHAAMYRRSCRHLPGS